MKHLKPDVHISWKQWLVGIDIDWGIRLYIGPIELVW